MLRILRPRHGGRYVRHLFGHRSNGTLPVMYQLARSLQLVALLIPPLAIFAQLAESISLGKMLGFLVASVAMFSIGYLLQHYISSGK